MSVKPWHKRYSSDFLAGTSMLDLEQRGCYGVLLDLMYASWRPLANDPQWLGRVCNCSTRRFRQLLEQLIDLRKIHLDADGRITNARFEVERVKATKKEQTSGEQKSLGISKHRQHMVEKRVEKSIEKEPSLFENNDLGQKTGGSISRARARTLQNPESKYVKAGVGSSPPAPAEHTMTPQGFSQFVEAIKKTIPRGWSPDRALKRWIKLEHVAPDVMVEAWKEYLEYVSKESKSSKYPLRVMYPENWFRERTFQNFLDVVQDRLIARQKVADMHRETLERWNGKAVKMVEILGAPKFDALFLGTTLDENGVVTAPTEFMRRRIENDGVAMRALARVVSPDVTVIAPKRRTT